MLEAAGNRAGVGQYEEFEDIELDDREELPENAYEELNEVSDDVRASMIPPSAAVSTHDVY